MHYVKSARIRSHSGPHFPAFGLNMERYQVSLRIRSECGKMRTRITPNMDAFCAVMASLKLEKLKRFLWQIWGQFMRNLRPKSLALCELTRAVSIFFKVFSFSRSQLVSCSASFEYSFNSLFPKSSNDWWKSCYDIVKDVSLCFP